MSCITNGEFYFTISFQFEKYFNLKKKKYQFQIATVLFLASATLAAPQYYYQPGYGYRQGYGYGNYQPQQAYRPQPLNTFRYAQNPVRSAALPSPTVRGTGLDSLSGKYSRLWNKRSPWNNRSPPS